MKQVQNSILMEQKSMKQVQNNILKEQENIKEHLYMMDNKIDTLYQQVAKNSEQISLIKNLYKKVENHDTEIIIIKKALSM